MQFEEQPNASMERQIRYIIEQDHEMEKEQKREVLDYLKKMKNQEMMAQNVKGWS